ncbi:MAG: 50S ribosomal protein L25 [Actinomycetota bacterium]|nr:50S ribosomal protein L25 [Actinomycetota bacterium]
MPEITLNVEPRPDLGSRSSRRMRSEGKVPAIIYGHGADALAIVVDARELQHALSTEAGLNALLTLEMGKDRHLALARELQRHPTRGILLHVDFQIVRRDEEVVSEVPVVLVGESLEVHRAGGLIEQQLFALSVKAVPDRIPRAIEADVSAMAIGDSIRVGDVVVPEGVSLEADADVVLVVAQPPVVAVASEAPEGAAETPEGASAPGVEAASTSSGPSGGEGGGSHAGERS